MSWSELVKKKGGLREHRAKNKSVDIKKEKSNKMEEKEQERIK